MDDPVDPRGSVGVSEARANSDCRDADARRDVLVHDFSREHSLRDLEVELGRRVGVEEEGIHLQGARRDLRERGGNAPPAGAFPRLAGLYGRIVESDLHSRSTLSHS